jgi:tape measure domain-containing protein
VSLTFDLLWRDHGAAAGLKNLGSQTASAAQGFDKLSAASAKASAGLARAQDAAAGASARLRVSEMRLADLRKSGSQDATKLASAEAAVDSARRRSVSSTAAVASASRRLAQAQKDEQGRLGKVSAAYATATGAVGKLGTVGGLALAGMGASAVAFGVKTASGNEQATIAFTTMLGSAQKAHALLKQLQQFAATTPFEFPELQTAAANLISVGIDANKVIPIMKTLGDVTSGMGTGAEGIKRAVVALQQMNAAQAIHAQDLNQLRDAGIPVYDLLSAALGKSKAEVVQLAQAGKLGKDALDKMMGALESGKGLERFNGLMQAQSQSLAGLGSNLNDALGQGLAKAITPLIPLMKVGLGGAIDVTTNHMNELIGAGGFFFTMWSVHKLSSVASGMAEAATQGGRFARGLTGVAGFLGGPWGIAIGIGATLIGGFVLKQKAADAATKAFTDSLTFQNGALDANSRASVAHKAATEGALGAALQAGVSENQFTDALIKGGGARQSMIDQLHQTAAAHVTYTMTANGTIPVTDGVGIAANRAAAYLESMGTNLDGSATSAVQTDNALKGTASAAKQTISPAAQMSKLTGELAGKNKALAAQLQQVIDKFTILKTGALDQATANMAWQQSIDDVSASVKQNGHSLDIHSEKGRNNRQAVINMMTALNDKTTADVKNAGEVRKGESATTTYSRVLRVATGDTRKGEAQIRAAAKAAGFNKDQVNAMIKQYLKTPGQVATDVKANNVGKTVGEIKHVQHTIDGVHDKTVNIKFRSMTGNFTITQSADGRTVRVKDPGLAEGGPVPGWSPHPKADNIPIMATAREFMQPVSAVDYYGVSGMEAIRQRRVPKEALQGLADGGQVWPWKFHGPAYSGAPVQGRGRTVDRSLTVNSGNIPGSAYGFAGGAMQAAGHLAAVLGKMLGKELAASLGGNYGPALSFAKSQAGKPYIWAAAGPGGYDCSGFMGAIENVILGQSPYHRRWSTGSFRGQHSFDHFTKDAHSPFMIGVTNAGVGHTAGTLNGVNVESRGGQGVVVGRSARGWNDPLFPMHYGFTGTPVGGRGGNGGQSASGIRGLAQSMLRARGWGDEYSSLNYVISHESGWDPHARNSSSGAYGLGQALPASKMAGYGPDYRNNAQTQLAWMLSYIGSRYGDPRGAESFWRGHHWYGSGGVARDRGLIGVAERGPERVLTTQQNRAFERLVQVADRQGMGTTVYVTVDAPNYVGSVRDLEAGMLRSAQSGGFKKVLRTAGVKI